MSRTSQALFSTAIFEADRAPPPGVTTSRGAVDAVRFAVYRNNVVVSLTKALEQRFPVTSRLVGGDFFRMMARAFIEVEKPRSPLMFAYGEPFPDFVERFPPARVVPYLADVARIERAWTTAYHAADAAPLTVADLAAISPHDLADTRLSRHPAAALVGSPYPAGSVWAAHQVLDAEPLTVTGAETVLIVRPDMEVAVHVLPKEDAIFAEALLGGQALGAAAEQALAGDPRFDFGRALLGLVRLGTFAFLGKQERQT